MIVIYIIKTPLQHALCYCQRLFFILFVILVIIGLYISEYLMLLLNKYGLLQVNKDSINRRVRALFFSIKISIKKLNILSNPLLLNNKSKVVYQH